MKKKKKIKEDWEEDYLDEVEIDKNIPDEGDKE